MMRKKIVLLVAFLSLILGSCSNDEGPNFHFTTLRIDAAELPESFELNQSYKVFIDYSLPDGCSFFEGFDITEEDITVRNIVAIGSIRTDVGACTTEVIEGQAFFNFTVIYNQPYIFKFYQGDDSEGLPEFLEVIVPVN